MTTDEDAAKVAAAVKDGKASPFVKFLFEILPKSAHGKIVEIDAWVDAAIDTAVDERIAESGVPFGNCVEIDLLNKRAVAETVQAYGLELDLDAAGLAVRVTTPYEFVA
jgi:hypothetical protein